MTGIDQALISKIENQNRIPTEKQVHLLAEVLNLDYLELRSLWLADKVVYLLQKESDPSAIMALAEPRIEYLIKTKVPLIPQLSDHLLVRLQAVDELKRQWIDKRPLNQLQLQKMNEYFMIEYTYDSNRIEGNTLTLQETTMIVQQGLTIGGKSVAEHLEAINHAEAVDCLLLLINGGEMLNRRTVLELHRLVLKGTNSLNAGRYRQTQVHITGSEHLPPQPYLLDKMMEDYFITYQRIKNSVHPVIVAADMHERLASIHPFIDGNGRTARLIMNMILMQHGYTICNLKGDNPSRLRYYQALDNVQRNNEPEHFYELIIDEVELSLKKHLAMT
jgi:Fic family protein